MADLQRFAGQTSVYLEGQSACLATLQHWQSDAEGIHARFLLVPQSFICRLRFLRSPDEEAIEEVLTEPPFGIEWSVAASHVEFDAQVEHWQATFLWGGGFRVFFQSTFVQRFGDGDVTWLDEFDAHGEE